MVKTTLLEGSVAVNGRAIMPGDQIDVTDAGKLEVFNRVDLTQVMAWKNGLFIFDGVTLPDILRQLGRWYDVDIDYESNISELQYYGKVPRSLMLSQVLKLLDKRQVRFIIEGKKIVVRP